MGFQKFWGELQTKLKPGVTVKNWTAAKGYLGDQFTVVAVSKSRVEIDSPDAEYRQYVPKGDFEVMYNNWDAYCSKKLQRQELRVMTRFSKYTMSIIKHLSGELA